jgi:DNA-binding Xre family transcriptional regulator
MMDKQWSLFLCDAQTRVCPVADFIESCRPAHQVKLIRIMKLLEEMGPNLPRPYADLLRNGIHELRVKLSGEQIRLLYFFCYESYIVFFEAVRKHTDAVPEKYIEETVHYRRDLLNRWSREQFAQMNRNKMFEYAERKLEDPEFRKQYQENCTVCKTTVALVHKLYSEGLSRPKLAARIGLPVEELTALEEGEKCRYDLVVKLCQALEVPVPEHCHKRQP